MAQRRELPELWDTILERKGISSLRHLARITNLSPATLSRAVHGDSEPSDNTVRTVADALGLELPAAYKLFGYDSPEAAPYVPPAEANRLTMRQRRAIDDLIRAIAAEREEEDDATQAENQAGNDPDVQGARDRTPMTDLGQHREKRRQDEIDSLNFGTPNKPGDLDQGKLQPPPARRKSAAYEPDEDLEGPAEARKSRDRGEENQDDVE